MLDKLITSIDNFSQIYKIFKKYGVCIITKVYTEEECNKWIDEILNNFENFDTGFDKNDTSTWKKYNLPPQTKPGMFQSLVAHFNPVWQIRNHQNTKKIFRKLYSKLRDKKIHDIMISCDGINVKPPDIGPFHNEKSPDWPHLDQTYGDAFSCIQGQAVLTNTDACFRCTPKSCKYFDEILELLEIKNNKTNWLKFTPEQINKIKDNIKLKYWQIPLYAEKGSFIIWSSSTIHSAQYATRQQNIDKYDKYSGWRCVIYICYRPKEDFTDAQIKKLKNMYKTNRVSNHWGTRMFRYNKSYKSL